MNLVQHDLLHNDDRKLGPTSAGAAAVYSEVYKEEVHWKTGKLDLLATSADTAQVNKVEEKEPGGPAAGQWELGKIDDDVVTS